MKLTINERQENDVSILELKGQLIMGPEAEALHNHVKKLLKAGSKKIILLVQGLKRVDSLGFGAIMASVASCRSAGSKLFLLQPSKQAQEVINITGIAVRPDLLPVFSDMTEAVRNF